VQLFLQQRTMPPPPIAQRSPGVAVPKALEAVVRRMLEKDPKDRYQTATEVVSALDTAMMTLAFEMVPELSSLPDSASLFGAKTGETSGAPPAAEEKTADDDFDQKATIVRGEPALPPAGGAYEAKPPPAKAAFLPPEVVEGARAAGSAGSSDDPFAKAREMFARIPGVAALAKVLPQNGRFPPWAYAALPIVALVFIFAMVMLSRRAMHAQGEAARTESVIVPAPLESAGSEGERAPAGLQKVERAGDVAVEPVGLDAAGWKMNLRNAVRQKEWSKGSEAVLTLLRMDPNVFRDHDVMNGMRNVAVALEDAGGEPADKFFGALTNDNGSDGLDLLYDIARFRTWTKAGKRATETLRKPEIMMRASTPLKALFEFREASCTAKRNEFGKLAEQGDDRALFELTSLQNADCRRRRDPCCFTDNHALAIAIKSLRARLAAPPAP
jgi:eukaryotic-like serine/threonine-protein kinase